MSASRQARRQLGRSLKVFGKAPLGAVEISPYNSELGAVAEEVRLAAGRCAACLSTSGERKSCHACGCVRYCNRGCQTAGWPSHKLVCRVLAADREIAASPMLSLSTPLFPLDTIWERLRSGGHAEAYEATVHLYIWANRSGLISKTPLTAAPGPPGHGGALMDEVAAAGGVALLVPGLAAGGLRTSVTAMMLGQLIFRCPEMGAAIVAAGALPPLIAALALPSKHAELGAFWELLAAAFGAADVIRLLGEQSQLGPAIEETGAVPALVSHLTFAMGDGWQPQPHWPTRLRELGHVRRRAVLAISGLFGFKEGDAPFAASTARACVAAAAVPPLTEALLSEDDETAAAASDALGCILRHSGDKALAATLGRDHAASIVSSLRRGTAQGDVVAAVHSADLLHDLIRLATDCRQAVLSAGGIPAVLALLSIDGKDAPAAISASTRVLAYLVADNPPAISEAFAAGALETLTALLKGPNSANPAGKAGLVAALLGLLSGASREQREKAVACGAARLFAEFLGVPGPLADHSSAALAAFLPAGDPYNAAVIDQLLEGCPPPRLMSLISKAELSFDLLDGITSSSAHTRQLLRAGLARALLAVLAFEGPIDLAKIDVQLLSDFQDPRDALRHAVVMLFGKLLCSPEAVAAANALVAAGCLKYLVASLGADRDFPAARGFFAISALAPQHRAAMVSAGAVPRLLAVLQKERGGPVPGLGGENARDPEALLAARTLLNLMKAVDASVTAEAAAAGFDAARLRQLAGLPDEPAAPASA